MKKNDMHVWAASGTNIEERWKLKYGWVKPSEQADYQQKFKYYQELPLRKLDDVAKVEYERILKTAKVARIR